MIIIDGLLYAFLIVINMHLLKIMAVLAVQWCSDRTDIEFCKFINIQYLKACARLKSGEVIGLLDYKDRVTYSVAVPMHIDDIKLSYINWQMQIAPIWLYEDGTVSRPHGEISHIQSWLPVDLEKRTFMILQGARGFDT